ncbi:MAG: ATP-dependent Clp protease ATP-binding subunit ClpA, partial [Pseudomonadota bacterium]
IQEHIKKPLAEELLFGKLEHGGAVKVIVEKDGMDTKLGFEFFPADPKRKSKSEDDEDGDEPDDNGEKALIEAEPRKALPGPKERKSRSSKGNNGAVPSVPPRKSKRSE